MSIDTIVASLAPNRKLYEVRSQFVDDETPRRMLVSADVDAAITQPFPDTPEGERRGELRAWLENFIELGEITVSEDPDNKPPETMLARTHPVKAEFWSIRVTEPPDTPGIRSLGGFAGKDEFIALTWDYREVIDNDFDGEVVAVQDAWKDHFGSTPPFRGDSLDEYLTNYRAV